MIDSKRRIATVLIAIVMVTNLTWVLGENLPVSVGKSNAKASDYLATLDRYSPTPTDSPTPQETLRYAKYLYHLGQYEEFVNNEGASINETYRASLSQHKSSLPDLATVYGSGSVEEVLDQLLLEVNEAITSIMNSLQEAPEDIDKTFRTTYPALREYLVVWSDTLVFYNDEVGLDPTKAEEEQAKLTEAYRIATTLGDGLGYDFNLTLTNPEGTYDESSTISQNLVDSNNNLKKSYVEVFTLSALTEGKPLEEYSDCLTAPSRQMLERYGRYRAPLYIGNESNPIASLYSKGNKNLKISRLADFLENAHGDEVLYMPLYTKDIKKLAEGEQAGVQDVEEVEDKDLTTSYIPVYIKWGGTSQIGSLNPFSSTIDVNTASSASMNSLQFVNYYESGKASDFQTDLAYPLFIDIYGNIQTYSGKVLIPSVSNNTLLANNEYFPLNAYFLNNYPLETSSNAFMELVTPDPTKYVITCKNSGVTDDEIEEGETQEIREMKKTSFYSAKLSKKGTLVKNNHVKFGQRYVYTLPTIIPYLEIEEKGNKQYYPFMSIVTKEAFFDYKILGHRNYSVGVNPDFPVEKWNYAYYYGEDGDRGRLKNDLLVKIAESCYNNPDIGFNKLKVSDSQRKTPGHKLGELLEPGHLRMSKATRNYVLYTPSIAEMPGMNEYLSSILIPLLKIVMVLAVVIAILRYLRYVKTMSVLNLAISLAVIVLANYGLTTFYPAVLNIGFNSSVSRVLGDNTYHLTLYNVEKDLNSKAEFIYTDSPTKIVSNGAYIKLANLSDQEVKRYRKAQENAPWKDSDYYLPKWDTSKVDLGESLFIKGNTLNINVKDLFSSCLVVHRNGRYELTWNLLPEYTYYTPYLSILEGIVTSVNSYTQGRIQPKVLEYQTGYQGANGGALAYFTSQYFLTEPGTAEEVGGEFLEEWNTFNGGDFLNLSKVLYLKEDFENFPEDKRFDVESTRWFKVATNNRTKDVLYRKISNVNLDTKNYIISLIPYMDNITDDVIFKMIALYATVRFDREFSKSPIENFYLVKDLVLDLVRGNETRDYFTTLYPKRLELDTISIDEHLKLGLVNMKDLLKFNVTSLYKFIENQSGWFGMLMLGINSLLLHVRSIFRIVFISIILMVIILYMVVVYAFKKDYTNKTIVGMLGIIVTSWGIYLIDNLMLLVFANTDKKSSGVLYLILLVWILWNVVATAVYLGLFATVFKDIRAFGGNIMYSSLSNALMKINAVAKAGLRLVSDTRAENFDITRPDFDMKASNFERYLQMDMDDKIALNQQELKSFASDSLDTTLSNLKGRMPEQRTIKEYYAMNKDKDSMTLRGLASTPTIMRNYMKSYGLQVDQDPRTNEYLFRGSMNQWKEVVESNRIKKDSFTHLYKEKDGNLYFPKSTFVKGYLNRAGVEYEEYGNTLVASSTEHDKVLEVERTLQTPIYRVNRSKLDALNEVAGRLTLEEYEVGKNALYIKDEAKARELFGNDVTPTNLTYCKIRDYSDRLSSGGYVADNLDLLNGNIITNEYVYGKVNKDVFHELSNKEIELTPMGSGTYRFNSEHRNEVMESLNANVRYTEGREGVVFQRTSPLDNLPVWDDTPLEEYMHHRKEEKTERHSPTPTLEGESEHK